MLIAMIDCQNDCSFGVIIEDESQKDLVMELMREGLDVWYLAAEDKNRIYPNDYFTKEEIAAFYESAYTEPTHEMLDKCGIKHEITSLFEDDRGNIICDVGLYY